MTTEDVADAVAKRVQRSRFLQRVGGVALAGIAGFMARPQSAHGGTWNQHGCHLCVAPNPCPPLTCSWCWLGGAHCHNGACRKHYCCEGYTQGNCTGACDTGGWVCSYYTGSFAATGCGGC
jgi:hypothetical protein